MASNSLNLCYTLLFRGQLNPVSGWEFSRCVEDPLIALCYLYVLPQALVSVIVGFTVHTSTKKVGFFSLLFVYWYG